MGYDDLQRDPNEETSFRWQNDKETRGPSANRRPPPWNEGEQLYDFVLEKLLGAGSSGFVYRVQDVKTARRFALKILHQGVPDDLLRNKSGFRRMMMFDHPNLLRVDRIHQLGSYIGLSMEEVEGQTFKRARSDLAKLPRDQAYDELLRILRDYASGLAAMHANGLVHRDIKPDNLMVDVNGCGRIIDYGLVDAYEMDVPVIRTRGFLLGTPHYIAPEVIWSQRYLPAGDIFGLGIVLLDTLRKIERSSVDEHYDLKLPGKHKGHDAEKIFKAIEDLPESVPAILLETCREMLERYPSERPQAVSLARLGLPTTHPIPWAIKPPMVGRDEETEICKKWVDDVFDGHTGRLHLSGESGVGKSRLVEEITEYIESKKWGQVFSAKCRVREDQPLQSFDQICDAIAHRYMKGDRERIRMDPVSVSILQSVFPVLQNVLEATLTLPPVGQKNDSWDALEASARFSQRLRDVGPLFLIIDDSQWADGDSRSVLDTLQMTACEVGLGVITVSRNKQDPHRVPASLSLNLERLNHSDGRKMLSAASSRWGVEASSKLIDRLAKSSDGLPFRLQELAEEFRPGGALHELDVDDDSGTPDLSPLQRLWQQRAERLSSEAKRVLPMLVTAGGQASMEQLGELTGLDDSVDAAVTELVRQRLVIDEATGGECISIYHDQVARELIKTFRTQMLREAHNAWAKLLIRQDDSERLAARIAGHLFAAEQPGRAVAHAILAAEDAENRVAKAEAGRWYARVLPYVKGAERIRQLRNAARCFHEADHPAMAARYYQDLSQFVEGEERIECLLLATTASIRCGRLEQIRHQLHELASHLQLPRPKPFLFSQFGIRFDSARIALGGLKSLASWVEDVEHCDQGLINTERPQGSLKGHTQSAEEVRTLQAIRLCQLLVRPLSIFDSQYAAELGVAGARLARRSGDCAQKVHVAVRQAVVGCYDHGRRRVESEASLLMLMPKAEQLGSHKAIGDLWSGIAYSHALACRWDHVSQPVDSAVKHFQETDDASSFEIADTRWIDLWAKWNLGQWAEMQRLGDRMLDDAIRRDDLFQRIVALGGWGVGAWLVRDRLADIEYQRRQAEEVLGQTERPQLFQGFDSIARIQTLLYQGKYDEAWSAQQTLNDQLRLPPFKGLQMFRVASQVSSGILCLHMQSRGEGNGWSVRIDRIIQKLRSERIGFASAVADYLTAMVAFGRQKHDNLHTYDQGVIELLRTASENCRERRLRPFYWSADDALHEIHTGQTGIKLLHRMRKAKVTCPEKLRRLYGVADPR
ncbi:MAG: AAA family ATPase [Planctomycetota bacterium]